MFNETENQEYLNLVTQWSIEKKAEQQANGRRLAIENKILELVKPALKESGTNNFNGGLKILTGLAATCDKEKVSKLYNDFMNGKLEVSTFPFKMKWEPELKVLNEIRTCKPAIYNEKIADAVVIKPKKPAFEVKK